MIFCNSLTQLLDWDKSINGNTFNSMQVQTNRKFKDLKLDFKKKISFKDMNDLISKERKTNFIDFCTLLKIKKPLEEFIFSKLLYNLEQTFNEKNLLKNFVYEVVYKDKVIFISQKNIEYYIYINSFNNYFASLESFNDTIYDIFKLKPNGITNDYEKQKMTKENDNLKIIENKLFRIVKNNNFKFDFENLKNYLHIDLIQHSINVLKTNSIKTKKLEKEKNFIDNLKNPIYEEKDLINFRKMKNEKELERLKELNSEPEKEIEVINTSKEIIKVVETPLKELNSVATNVETIESVVIYQNENLRTSNDFEKIEIVESNEASEIKLTNSFIFRNEISNFENDLTKFNTSYEVFKFTKMEISKLKNHYLKDKFSVISQRYILDLEIFNQKVI